MTETGKPDRTEEASDGYRPTLGEMSHTNPYTGDPFGDTQTYGRGRLVAADGGADPEREADGGTETSEETLRDVDHTPPEDSDGAAPVYERGHEGRDVREPDEDGS